MSELSRREWNKLALGALTGGIISGGLPTGSLFAADKPNSKFNGVQVGTQSYSFRDRPLDDALKGMVEVGLSSCELWAGHVEPRFEGASRREELRKWRLSAPLDEFKAIRAKFDKAGVDLYALNYSMRDDFTDEELERGFVIAKALGAKAITTSSNVSTAKRIDQFARKHKMRVGMHNHSNIRPNEFATPDDFAAAMNGTSEYIAVNLDIGHFTAAGFDPVDYLKKHHERVVTLHIKDRKRNQGDNVPFGEGDTPIKQVLSLLRQNRWKIPANIEYEYRGADTVEEMKKCLAYCKRALTTHA
jgi:sugar phosphate isomerase/epimerase